MATNVYHKDIEVRSFALGRPPRPGFSCLPDAGNSMAGGPTLVVR